MKKYFIWTLAFALLTIGSTFAAMPSDVTTSSSSVIMPENPQKFYKMDTKAITPVMSGAEFSLQEITCPRDNILQTLGLLGTLGSNRKWTNLTYEDTVVKMFVSYDLIGCNFNAYATDITYENLNIIAEDKALEAAKAFMATAPFKDVIKANLGEPIIVSKYNNNVNRPMPMFARGHTTDSVVMEGKLVSNTATGFTNYNILFPYVIGGKKVYFNYGGRAGINLEVNENGVVSYNGQFIALPGTVNTNAKTMNLVAMLKFAKRGGNNPYYGNKTTINVDSAERIFVIVNDWRNNKNTLYLASGTLFPTNVQIDDYNPWNKYEMVIVDYAFANPNLNPTPMYK